MRPYTERIRKTAERLVRSGEELLALGHAQDFTDGRHRHIAIGISPARLFWASPGEPAHEQEASLDDIVRIRERDDGGEVRLFLRHGSTVVLGFSRRDTEALTALRAQLLSRGVTREVWSVPEEERAQRRASARGETLTLSGERLPRGMRKGRIWRRIRRRRREEP